VLVTKLYQECGVEVETLFPKVLIRVLPKEQKRGEIWLPDGREQNKPTWEGIVLKTYKPFYQKIFLTEARWVKDDPDPEVRYTQKVECQFKPGDHILFPYIAFGEVPVNWLDGGKGDYRAIPEDIILGKLEYTTETVLDSLANFFFENEMQDGNRDLTKDRIKESGFLQRYDVIRKDVVAQTISGR